MVGPGVRLEGVSRRFALDGGHWVTALDEVSLVVPPGGYLVIMGPNGAGKSCLLRAIDRSLEVDAGTIEVAAPEGGGKASIIHLAQDPMARLFSKLTLAEHFLLAELDGHRPGLFGRGVDGRRRKRYKEILEQFERQDLVPFLDRPVQDLSGGMRQAAAMLTAVGNPTSNPKLLLVDEPTASLDVENAKRCLDLLDRFHHDGATVLLVTHDPVLAAERGEQVILMNRGRIAKTLGPDEKRTLDAAGFAGYLADLVVGKAPGETAPPLERQRGA